MFRLFYFLIVAISAFCLIWAEKSNDLNEDILLRERNIFPKVDFAQSHQICLGDTLLDLSSKLNTVDADVLKYEWVKIDDSLFRFQFQDNHLIAWVEKNVLTHQNKFQKVNIEEDFISKKVSLSDGHQLIMRIFSYPDVETFHLVEESFAI